MVAVNQGELVELDPEYRLLRGAANVMMRPQPAAQDDLNSASCAADQPSAALWRGYAARSERRIGPKRGASWSAAPARWSNIRPAWRARFQVALANAAWN